MFRFERHHVGILLERLKERPDRLIVISGPRQTGKTTLIRQTLHRTDLEWDYIPVGEPEPEEPLSPDNAQGRTVGSSDVLDGHLVAYVPSLKS